jgi:hypothetical protein
MPSLVWRRTDIPGLEHVSLSGDGAGWRLHGVAVFAHETQPCRLDYDVRTDERWLTRTALVTGSVGPRAIDVRIEAHGGHWRLGAVPVPAVDGCLDVDLNFSPSTNLLPVRRLALAIGQRATVRAAWLRFPGFTLEPLEQAYERLDGRRYRYQSNGGAFTAEIEVRDDGLAVRYGDLWIAEAGA